MAHASATDPMAVRVRRLEARVRRLTTALVALVVLAVGALTLGANRIATGDVLRARALILVDEEGRERIALGAPIPELEGRRYDQRAVVHFVQQEDGKWRAVPYDGPRRGTTGLVLLDEHGVDRMALGSPVPDPVDGASGQVVRRMVDTTGLVLFDADGNERSGYSLHANGTIALGLDWVGSEAVSLFADETTGEAGIRFLRKYQEERGFLGFEDADEDLALEVRDAEGEAGWKLGPGGLERLESD